MARIDPKGSLSVRPDPGPDNPSGASGTGLIPGPVFRYEFGAEGGSARLDGRLGVPPHACLAFALFPELQFDPPGGGAPDPVPNVGSCLVGVRVLLDGKAVELTDQYGQPSSTEDPGWLWTDQWNWLEFDLADLAGATLSEVELVAPPGHRGSGWFQLAGVRTTAQEPADVVARATMMRGSHSDHDFSRGNTYPMVFRPGGSHALAPLTDARAMSWLYRWNDRGPVPRMQGFGFVHAPSPWIGDRNNAHFMPWMGRAEVTPERRELLFRHLEETSRPDLYTVRLVGVDRRPGSIAASMTATQHGGVLRFDYETQERCGLVVDQPFGGRTRIENLPDGRAAIIMSIDARVGFDDPDNPMPGAYVYAETLQPVQPLRATEMPKIYHDLRLGEHGLERTRWGHALLRRLSRVREQAGVLRLRSGQRLEIKAAMSSISVEQARHNLDLEIGRRGFDEVAAESHALWAEILGRLEIEGGRPWLREAAWSDLARLLAWPRSHHENAGSPAEPHPVYASPFRPRVHPDTAEHTGCAVVDGELVVDNGYWDTYRTAWPAYHLLFPKRASRLLDGIVQQYRDSGWMSRWSAPGHIDCMVGTSSDTIFADASAHGIAFDELTAYESAVKNATVPSASPLTGRKSIARGRFTGWIDTDETEGFSWTVENAICDASIALWSRRLADRATELGVPDRAEEFRTNARYFTNRSLVPQACYDPDTGFWQGRRPDGRFRLDSHDFDPLLWGYDYTETSAWGMAFATVQDGAGLARLLGGEQALASRLDRALATPEPANDRTRGSYPQITHEMTEARAVRLGQIAVSNQPAHHSAYMYLHAGRPDATQWLTREIAERLWVGSEIGQGYPGDEDNGEMSAWQLFTMVGLYPLQPGSGELVLSAPVFPAVRWHRENGTTLEIVAHDVEHRFIQRVEINGEPWGQVSVPVAVLHANCRIEFWLGAEPSDWGSRSRPASMSTMTGEARSWQPDRSRAARLSLTGPDGREMVGEQALAQLVDDRGEAIIELPAGACLELRWSEPFRASHLTLTTDGQGAAGYRLEALAAGGWAPVQVHPTAALWRNQTVPQALGDKTLSALRLTITAPLALRQIEVY
ncbi:alpha-1,2-mannosidase, putative [Propionibacterium cyclohexanicum]|uniref:Alpha-1,2-mannosidase, putative n=1 Tax=Propionibacterium cyclohexanicum TaxID=64702 RepID=A0A1H9PHE5_9ACTN|nr:GH92 family glycosyl hydrolase [Propionibacterium cyclohexanicum]SER47598.1 alpha-1,2-mannosidase, putative [Propionibacterium cyclohexanicum]